MIHIRIESSTDEPIYEQIARQIRTGIFSGDFKPGDALPSIRQLAKDLQISVITTKRAYEELEREGFIDSMVGKGSFISGANPQLIREQRLHQMEMMIEEAVKDAKALNVSLSELMEHIRLVYEESE
ncbi:GntR family transcriptional regulator [Paenibacillus sp. chi10]|uniref:GntR family transcriptional regulator n=1 Tax=Paenibacillus suaedae TaxID=3077233 RepID=A0AAJ2N538_9BACL|nr:MULTISPECIES: GntR family transcriptional regulator [unclassified Paenibacillus]MDT8980038.1 GntR family transcriptional regulator [Paenibacillus sp. chi10]GAV15566.1 GntR family transcriptional regulator [Paenibacillus sp. NAIST15-1]